MGRGNVEGGADLEEHAAGEGVAGKDVKEDSLDGLEPPSVRRLVGQGDPRLLGVQGLGFGV